MFPARGHHRYTYAEFGEIYAMAGGSEEYSALAAEVLGAVRSSAES